MIDRDRSIPLKIALIVAGPEHEFTQAARAFANTGHADDFDSLLACICILTPAQRQAVEILSASVKLALVARARPAH